MNRAFGLAKFVKEMTKKQEGVTKFLLKILKLFNLNSDILGGSAQKYIHNIMVLMLFLSDMYMTWECCIMFDNFAPE